MEHALSFGMQACLPQRERRKGNPKKKKREREEKNKRQGTSLGGCM